MPDIISGHYEWDSDKNRINKDKHRIAFEDAKTLFDEPHLRLLCTDQTSNVGLRSERSMDV